MSLAREKWWLLEEPSGILCLRRVHRGADVEQVQRTWLTIQHRAATGS